MLVTEVSASYIGAGFLRFSQLSLNSVLRGRFSVSKLNYGHTGYTPLPADQRFI